MKTVLTLITTLTFLTGCVDKNGFDNFNFTPKQEHWENNQVTTKIESETQIDGTISAVYLNKVMPELYKNGEYFYVSLYLKDESVKLSFSLNAQNSLLQEKLKNNEEFQQFDKNTNRWNSYYIVGFAEQKDVESLRLEAKGVNLTSGKMIFKKDE
ncbi:MAG: hypothetical protein ABXS93_01515 [Sulfurimonas sp.]